MKILLVASLLFLTGCDWTQYITRKEQFDVKCSPQCYVPCNEKVPKITADPDSARVSLAVSEAYRVMCEARRSSCTECIDRGKTEGVLK